MGNWGSHRTLRLMNSGETSWLLPCPKGPRKIASLNFVKDKKWQSSNICKLLGGGKWMEKGFLVGSSSEWSPKLRVKRCQKKVRWSWSKTYPSIKLAKSIHMASEQIIKLSSPWQSALAWSCNSSKRGMGRRNETAENRERRKGTNTEITQAALETQDLDITFKYVVEPMIHTLLRAFNSVSFHIQVS